jgi:hypothetical protein
VLLLLIQLGGLGIMTLSTAALGFLGRRLSVQHEEAVAGLYSHRHRGRLFVALRRTLVVTFAAEAAATACLAVLFWSDGDGFAAGLWRGLFTAVSAFCNAGFALQSDSLIAYQRSPAVLHTVAVLIIIGGLSPAVVVALPRIARRKAVPVQVKMVLAATAGLLLLGFTAFAAIEWNYSLAGMSLADRLHNAWFQSVTFRTAGFNSVDFGHLRAATIPMSPDRRDACICAIGDESRESSIICTALLRQLGARRVLARATDPVHERILGLIGAHEVVNPESVVGQRVAMRMAHEGVRDELTLGGDLVVTDVVAPAALLGHSLAALDLRGATRSPWPPSVAATRS